VTTGNLTASTSLTATTSSGPITVQTTSALSAGTSATLTAATDLSILGSTLGSGGAMSLTAGGGALTVSGGSHLTGGTSLTGSATGDVTVSGTSVLEALGTDATLSAGASLAMLASSLSAAGGIVLQGNGGTLTLTSSTLTAGTTAALSALGDVTITATSLTTSTGSITVTAGSDALINSASGLSAATDLTVTATDGNIGLEQAASALALGGDLLLDAGTDVHQAADTLLGATGRMRIHGDQIGPADPAGSTILIEGTLVAPDIEIAGGSQADTITLRPVAIVGYTRVLGGDGADSIVLDQLPTIDLAHKLDLSKTGAAQLVNGHDLSRLLLGVAVPLRDIVELDGQGGADSYTINLTGASDYLVSVHDSGAPGDGSDLLTINGTTGNDTFLLRSGFVALIPQDGTSATYERINYDETINALAVNGGAGDDQFFVDDNSAITTLDGGAGKDSFQFGQLFGSDRNIPSVAPGDEIATVLTTAGYLSRGVSYATTAFGGSEDDTFTVYSNKAPLKLFGEDGNDLFLVRAFLIAGSGTLASGTTLLSGGLGDDHFEYNINAPVSIDGGGGLDTVIAIGTEANDTFVITSDGVTGGGLSISFVHIERLEVDGLSGDDTFYVLSTPPGVVTTLVGDNGNDTFNIGGDVTLPIVARAATGQNGFINHSVSSADPAFNGIFAPGVTVNSTGGGSSAAANAGVVITQTGGSTIVYENPVAGSQVDTYTVGLSMAAPSTPTIVYVTVAPTFDPSALLALGGGSVEVSIDGVHYFRSLVIAFDSTKTGSDPMAWDRSQTVYVRALVDGVAEGELTTIISHSTYSTNAAFNALPAANVEVRVIDTDQAGLVVTQPAGGTTVVEGGAPGVVGVALTQALAAGHTVTVSLAGIAGQLTVSSADSRFDALTQTLTFGSGDWYQPVLLTLTAIDNALVDGERAIPISLSASGDPAYTGLTDLPAIPVTIRDNDIGGVLIVPSDGSTSVSPGHPDTYTIQHT
ncbi:MAG: hypothetical protein QOF12_1603, partial [Solirubrobacteraceae bacterium]|nr:hypothetical protein [Solirubrobacteraceae bacterium]